jgi:hypothetical protein
MWWANEKTHGTETIHKKKSTGVGDYYELWWFISLHISTFALKPKREAAGTVKLADTAHFTLLPMITCP